MKVSLSRRCDQNRRRSQSDAAPPMSMHAVSLLLEAIFLKTKSLQGLGRFEGTSFICFLPSYHSLSFIIFLVHNLSFISFSVLLSFIHLVIYVFKSRDKFGEKQFFMYQQNCHACDNNVLFFWNCIINATSLNLHTIFFYQVGYLYTFYNHQEARVRFQEFRNRLSFVFHLSLFSKWRHPQWNEIYKTLDGKYHL